MKISAQLATILAAVFALVCFGVAIQGLTSLDGITDPTQLADARGFAGFWAFLGAIGVLCAGVSWFIAKREDEKERA
jgi:hypothetical protein